MKVAFAPIGLIALMLLIGLVIGLIILLVKGGKTVRWIFGGVLLVALLLFFSLFSYNVIQPRTVEQVVDPVTHHNVIPVPITEDSTLWQPHLERELIPDVYSSKETAAYGLGMQLLETIETASDKRPEKILILETSAGGDLSLLEQFRQGLKTSLGEAGIVISKPATSSPAGNQLWIELSVQPDNHDHNITIPELKTGDRISMQQSFSIGNACGTVEAVVQSPEGKFIKVVAYDYRPWVFDPTQSLSDGTGWQPKVFRSHDTAVSEEQAIEQAMEQVRRSLIYPKTLENLRTHGMLNDQYTQKLQGLSGPIWRAALLVDVNPGRLQALRQSTRSAQQAVIVAEKTMQRSWAGLILQFVGMIALITLVYIVINSLTKGYYSTWLGFLAVLLVMILSGLILLMH